ncbi:MAG: hypothetical protein ACE5IK_12805, partial [Acidobacteriota bacterium]
LDGHLASCDGCRREAAGTAPLTLFHELTRQPLPEPVADEILRCLTRLPASRQRRGWRWSVPALGPLLRQTPALAALLLTGVLMVVWAIRGPDATPARLDSPIDSFVLEPMAMIDAMVAVEDIRSPTAEVFSFSVAGHTGPTQVVMIVDRSMDL